MKSASSPSNVWVPLRITSPDQRRREAASDARMREEADEEEVEVSPNEAEGRRLFERIVQSRRGDRPEIDTQEMTYEDTPEETLKSATVQNLFRFVRTDDRLVEAAYAEGASVGAVTFARGLARQELAEKDADAKMAYAAALYFDDAAAPTSQAVCDAFSRLIVPPTPYGYEELDGLDSKTEWDPEDTWVVRTQRMHRVVIRKAEAEFRRLFLPDLEDDPSPEEAEARENAARLLANLLERMNEGVYAVTGLMVSSFDLGVDTDNSDVLFGNIGAPVHELSEKFADAGKVRDRIDFHCPTGNAKLAKFVAVLRREAYVRELRVITPLIREMVRKLVSRVRDPDAAMQPTQKTLARCLKALTEALAFGIEIVPPDPWLDDENRKAYDDAQKDVETWQRADDDVEEYLTFLKNTFPKFKDDREIEEYAWAIASDTLHTPFPWLPCEADVEREAEQAYEALTGRPFGVTRAEHEAARGLPPSSPPSSPSSPSPPSDDSDDVDEYEQPAKSVTVAAGVAGTVGETAEEFVRRMRRLTDYTEIAAEFSRRRKDAARGYDQLSEYVRMRHMFYTEVENSIRGVGYDTLLALGDEEGIRRAVTLVTTLSKEDLTKIEKKKDLRALKANVDPNTYKPGTKLSRAEKRLRDKGDTESLKSDDDEEDLDEVDDEERAKLAEFVVGGDVAKERVYGTVFPKVNNSSVFASYVYSTNVYPNFDCSGVIYSLSDAIGYDVTSVKIVVNDASPDSEKELPAIPEEGGDAVVVPKKRWKAKKMDVSQYPVFEDFTGVGDGDGTATDDGTSCLNSSSFKYTETEVHNRILSVSTLDDAPSSIKVVVHFGGFLSTSVHRYTRMTQMSEDNAEWALRFKYRNRQIRWPNDKTRETVRRLLTTGDRDEDERTWQYPEIARVANDFPTFDAWWCPHVLGRMDELNAYISKYAPELNDDDLLEFVKRQTIIASTKIFEANVVIRVAPVRSSTQINLSGGHNAMYGIFVGDSKEPLGDFRSMFPFNVNVVLESTAPLRVMSIPEVNTSEHANTILNNHFRYRNPITNEVYLFTPYTEWADNYVTVEDEEDDSGESGQSGEEEEEVKTFEMPELPKLIGLVPASVPAVTTLVPKRKPVVVAVEERVPSPPVEHYTTSATPPSSPETPKRSPPSPDRIKRVRRTLKFAAEDSESSSTEEIRKTVVDLVNSPSATSESSESSESQEEEEEEAVDFYDFLNVTEVEESDTQTGKDFQEVKRTGSSSLPKMQNGNEETGDEGYVPSNHLAVYDSIDVVSKIAQDDRIEFATPYMVTVTREMLDHLPYTTHTSKDRLRLKHDLTSDRHRGTVSSGPYAGEWTHRYISTRPRDLTAYPFVLTALGEESSVEWPGGVQIVALKEGDVRHKLVCEDVFCLAVMLGVRPRDLYDRVTFPCELTVEEGERKGAWRLFLKGRETTTTTTTTTSSSSKRVKGG